MPGIFGIISKRQKETNENELMKMCKIMSQEPIYSSGIYSICDLGIYVGWTCHKGSFSDCMPVKNEKKI